jgi:hypothetical protein
MSAGSESAWDFVVPSSSEDLMSELRRHGVQPGQRVHLSVVPALEEDDALDPYIGSFDSGDPTLAERSEEILEELIRKQA